MSNALQHHSGSPPDASVETVQVRTEECQRIVEEAITGVMSGPEFLEPLKGVGVTTEEARDYIDQYSQRRRDREAAGTADEGSQPPDHPNLDNPNPIDTATSVAWALLRSKVSHLQPTSPQATSTPGNSLSDELANLLGLCSRKHPTYPSSLTRLQTTLTLKRLKIFFQSTVPKALRISLSIKLNLLWLAIPSPAQFGARSFSIYSLTSKNFSLQWIKDMITMTSLKTLGLVTHWLKRIKLSLSVRYGLKLIGYGYLERGLQVWHSSSLIGTLSFGNTEPLSWTFSEQPPPILSLLSRSMFMFTTSIRRNPSILTIELNLIYHSSLKCFRLLCQQIPRVVVRELFHRRLLRQVITRSMRMYLAAIGALVRASPRFVQIAASMGSAVSAVEDTERKTMNSALLSSRLATECELLGLRENVMMFTEKGPRSLGRPLKCKASVILEPP